MGLHQTKKIFHSGENYQQKVKTTYWMRKTFANNVFNKWLISKICNKHKIQHKIETV